MIKQTKREVPAYTINEFRKKTAKYCICIPVINEGEKIKNQLVRMKPYAKLVDIIMLDKGSTDGSMEKNFLKKQDVRTLLTMTSSGKQGAQLRMGFAYALDQGYEGILTMDGNGKDGVEAIPSFVTALDEEFDYVQGSRFIKGGQAINTPFSRWFAIRFLHAPILSLAAHRWYTDTTNGFRAYSKRYITHKGVQPFRNIFSNYDLLFYLTTRAARLGLKTKEIPVTRQYPKNKIPTKIIGIKGNFNVLLTALKVLVGFYNPSLSISE